MTMELMERYESLKREGTAPYPRDAAKALGVSEAELVASLPHTRRLGGSPQSLLRELASLGEVKTMTRNELAVLERWGRFEEIEATEGAEMGQVVGADIDLRIFFRHFGSMFLVDDAGSTQAKSSLQVFDGRGDSVFKLFAETEQARRALRALAGERLLAEPGPLLTAAPERAPLRADLDDHAAFHAAWDALQDTHGFFGLLARFQLPRIRALEIAGPARAREVDPASLEAVLRWASDEEQPIMIFVGSRGVIQIHTGLVHNVTRARGWLNVLDPGHNLHVRDERLARAFVVKKPTGDGPVTSLELYDEAGEVVSLLFSKRKPGQVESAAWRSVAADLPGKGEG